MINFAVSFIAGIAAFNFFQFYPFSIITACIATALFLFFRHHKDKKRVLSVFLIFAFGFLYSFMRQETLPEIELPDRKVIVEGTVIDVPEMSGEKGRFTIDKVYMDSRYVEGKVRLFILPEGFYSDNASGFQLPSYADRIKATAKLRIPGTLKNPGVYSYDLRKQGIVATGYIKNLQTTGKETGFLTWINKKRQILGEIIDNSLSAENASLHRAIIPGLKRGLSTDMRDAFSATGLAHILSISGTHFGLLAFIIFKFIKFLFKSMPKRFLTRVTLYITPTQIAVVSTLPVLILYAFISGASTPAIRSMIMVFIYMLALFLGRKGWWLNSLSIAAVIILLWKPDALFELSFQLSFIAVLSIGYVIERKSEYRPDPWGSTDAHPMSEVEARKNMKNRQLLEKTIEKLKTGVMITIAAVFGTAPVVALVFKQFPLISPAANLIVTPLICFVLLPLGFFTGFIALLFNMSSMPLSGLTDTLTSFALYITNVFSEVPYSNIHVHNPSIVIITIYFASMFFIFKSRLKWRVLPFVLVILFYLVTPYLPDNNSLRITFLDVGQGDSAVVKLPDKKTMVIDGGTYEPDMGRMVIAPYLWSQGIRKADYLVLSHPHPDHYGGLIYITDNFEIGEVWSNGRSAQKADDFFQKIKEKKIPHRVLKRGDVLETEGYKILALHPYDEFPPGSPRGEFSNVNSESLVLKIGTDKISALFTGDIEAEAEEDIVHLGKWLKSDVLKVPHHGGRTSSTEEFLKMVAPEIAVISAGENNPFNHPHSEAFERYQDAGVRVYRTDIDGAVTVALKEGSYLVNTYWDIKPKRVRHLKDEMRNLGLLF